MPRLSPSLLRRAHRISPHLAALLPACRDLASARNELRWIRGHVLSSSPSTTRHRRRRRRRDAAAAVVLPETETETETETIEARIAHLCRLRGRRGLPLQYVLGSQPFGDLEIECRPGVLIPRAETEAWVLRVVGLVAKSRLLATTRTVRRDEEIRMERPLRIVDFCTGTGCIALLLYALLRRYYSGGGTRRLSVYGFDIDEKAVALARRNLAANVRRGSLLPPGPSSSEGPDARNPIVVFEKADVFSEDWRLFLRHGESRGRGRGRSRSKSAEEGEEKEERNELIDVLVANPPYISARGFNHDTGRSVRNHEPKLALVPDPALSLLRRSSDSSHDGGDFDMEFSGTRPEDIFYARLLQIAKQIRPRIVVFEVGDLAQAVRVVEMALSGTQRGGWDGAGRGVEIWRDWPDMVPSDDEAQVVEVCGVSVTVKGSGNGRVVVLRCNYKGDRRE